MGTVVAEKAIVLTIPPTILGPESEYERRRLAIKADTDRILAEAKKIVVVNDPESLENTNNIGRLLQSESKEIEVFFKPIKSEIDALKKPVLAAEKALADALDAEKRRLGGLITGYNQEVERKRQEEERKAREEAERVAREEALARAVELEASGDAEAAEQLLNEPIMPAPVVIQAAAPVKMAGQVGTTRLVVTVTDPKAVYKAIAEGRLSMECAPINVAWLNKKANLEKQGFNVAGCSAKPESSTHFRA